MASGAGYVEDLSPNEYEDMLKEALNLKMIPYDLRVWDRYLFSQCGTDITAAKRLLKIYWSLIENFGTSVWEIGQWCQSGRVQEKVRERMPIFPFPTFQFPHTQEPDLSKLWDVQAKGCLVSPPDYQKDVDTTRQYFYYIFGMIVWRVYPKSAWVCDEKHAKLDVWYELGYATGYDSNCHTTLHRAYDAILSREPGIGTMRFNQLSSLNHLKAMVAQAIIKGGRSQLVFRNNFQSFFEKQSSNSEESVWRLRHALALSDSAWEHMTNNDGYDLFMEAAWDYCLTTPYEDQDHGIVLKNLREVYKWIIVNGKDPLAMHEAREKGELTKYVIDNCGIPILKKTEDLIKLLDSRTKTMKLVQPGNTQPV
ncbi:hypothetical protein ZTR_04361 [Talaromyces verruculosus]|nr:hypothetical protein ZTR_04361 [Talaromyces verruculosus]